MQQIAGGSTDVRVGSRMIAMTVPLDVIDPHPDNPNMHDEEQIAGLEASSDEFGQFRTFIVWQRPNGRFIQVTSHGITQAMRNRGEHSARVEALPEDTNPLVVKRIMLADNQHARKSSDDPDILMRLLMEQQQEGYDLLAIGSSTEEVSDLLEHLGEEQEDEGGKSKRALKEPGGGEVELVYNVLVIGKDEQDQQRAYDLLTEEGFSCRILTL